MDIQLLEKHFEKIGARVKVREFTSRWGRSGIDIRNDQTGEFFDIRVSTDEQVEYEVVDLQKDLRHLLLLARRSGGSKEKFLCGHDERHWFVCAVPGRSVSSVTGAMEALQPVDVRFRIKTKLKRIKNRFTRRNEAFLRQGEWFFIPAPDLVVEENFMTRIFKNEPITRGSGSKPHICEEVFRTNGETVMVCSRHPSGVTMKQYNHILKSNTKAAGWNWRAMQRNASVFARGRVRHPDHKTIVLNGWHRVLMNTESEAPGVRNVVFLD